jgi:hypothetical protein
MRYDAYEELLREAYRSALAGTETPRISACAANDGIQRLA